MPEGNRRRVRFVSDGTIAGSRLLDAESGDEIEGVTRVALHSDSLHGSSGTVRATVTFDMVEVDAVAEMEP